MSSPRAGIAITLAFLLAGNAFAASISGRTTDDGGVGLPMEVRLYVQGTKGWYVAYTTVAAANGDYTFSGVTPDGYRVFARMSETMGGNYADRWYDVAPPSSNGWISDDADTVLLPDAATDITGIDLVHPIQGGLDGHVTTSGGTPLAGMVVRTEWVTDPRYYHDDLSQGNYLEGNFYMRGLVADDFRGIVYDSNGVYETGVFNGPFTVTSGANGALPNFVLNPEPADPHEPNNSPFAGGSRSVDDVGLHAVPSIAWSSSDARIGPRDADIDWHCFDAVAGDHFALETTTWLDVGGSLRPHPWTDPILGFWTGDGSSLIAWSDDVDRLNPALELWIDADGTYCAVVSTYGDTSWNGSQHGSTGRYQLDISMLNRRPTLVVSDGGVPAPAPPAVLTRAESEQLVLGLAFADPDQDALVVTAVHLDDAGGSVADGVLVTDPIGVGTFTWDIPPTAATDSPYTLEVTVEDGEFSATVSVIIVTLATNIPPTTPPPIAPAMDAVVATDIVDLVVDESVDADGDPLAIEYEVLYGDSLGIPDQSGSVPQTTPPTTFTTTAIAENTEVFWRARAYDAQLDNPYSPWTPWQHFRVDIGNDPPPPPVIYKPSEGSMVLSHQPTMSVSHVTDPDGDVLTYEFQVASDELFATVLTTSPPQPAGPAPTSAWTVDLLLDWDTTYWVRARADDGRGGVSDFGENAGFRTKRNILPNMPVFVDPDSFACDDFVYRDARPDSTTIAEVIDPEGVEVTLELVVAEYYEAIVNPDEATPITTNAVVQDPTLVPTAIPFDSTSLLEDQNYAYAVRAVDDVGTTWWVVCGWWLDVVNGIPGATTISDPADGGELAVDGEAVYLDVVPGSDPETANGVPGAWSTLAYCATLGASADCDEDASTWARLDTSEVLAASSTVIIEPVAEDEQWTVKVCTLDQRGACGAEATVTFTVTESDSGSPPGGCNCGAAATTGMGWAVALFVGLLVRRRRQVT